MVKYYSFFFNTWSHFYRHRRPNVKNLGPEHHFATFDVKDIVQRYINGYRQKYGHWPRNILFSINIDGVSPFKSSAYGFWTLLVRFHGLKTAAVLPVAVVYGRGKPGTKLWMSDGLEALKQLVNNGLGNLSFQLGHICAGTETFEY